MKELTCFKAYDIRGKLGEELNNQIAYDIGRAYAQVMKPKLVVVGGDARETSDELKLALARGLMDAGVGVIDLGMTGTEEIYFATSHLGVDGGIEVTASHNPIDYNGMKLVTQGSRPIGRDNGLTEIQALAQAAPWRAEPIELPTYRGAYKSTSLLSDYVCHLMSYVKCDTLKPLKIVVNAGNGAAGHVIDQIELAFLAAQVPVTFIKVNHKPDPSFPNGIPNPLLPQNRAATADVVRAHGADLGVAWDGDFDRCFLFDENGEFIEGYYIVGLLAEAYLQQNLGATIIHDPRLTWNTIDVVEAAGGKAVMSRTGHAFIKNIMRSEDAVYGGEMSAHHYFKDFSYCDSGMIPWLFIMQLMSTKQQTLSSMVKERIAAFPSSGEINKTIANPDQAIAKVKAFYQHASLVIDQTDGLSMEFEQWRFNLRQSNTEPLVRLNVETRANEALLKQQTTEIIDILESMEALQAC
ncbi:phosphomannomutase CpsG [Echinimonas agarilytica]|uniref:phosphomannomutase n=1 Tax=Echinimonas agarilytica TaxID=1215918 RepID=A0AA41W558_9GAMM|nr:phosphomannomutase CpsG [Echinimonas agarilytica]MCM2678707.1 phosphomannomutase CpsG [Echinimonas agarilytica]